MDENFSQEELDALVAQIPAATLRARMLLNGGANIKLLDDAEGLYSEVLADNPTTEQKDAAERSRSSADFSATAANLVEV